MQILCSLIDHDSCGGSACSACKGQECILDAGQIEPMGQFPCRIDNRRFGNFGRLPGFSLLPLLCHRIDDERNHKISRPENEECATLPIGFPEPGVPPRQFRSRSQR